MSTESPPPFREIVIAPSKGWRFAAWEDLYAYRDLLWLLVWRDFATRYKQTMLGPLWHIIQPIGTTIIFSVVFSQVAELPTDGLPPTLFYLCGLLAWNYFSQTFNSTSGRIQVPILPTFYKQLFPTKLFCAPFLYLQFCHVIFF